MDPTEVVLSMDSVLALSDVFGPLLQDIINTIFYASGALIGGFVVISVLTGIRR